MACENGKRHSVIVEVFDFLYYCAIAPSRPRPHYRGFPITLRHTTPGWNPMIEWSARRKDLYLTTHKTHNRQTSMSRAGFEPTIPASERPQTRFLDRPATGIGVWLWTDKTPLYSELLFGVAWEFGLLHRAPTGWTVRGSNPGGGKIFRTCPDRPWGPPIFLYNGYRVFHGGKSGRGVTLTPHLLLVPWSWKSRALLLLCLWAVRPVQSLSACTWVILPLSIHRAHWLLSGSRVQLKCDGARWRTGGEVKGKQENGVGNQ
jgi:hypothetical protein